MKKPIHPANRSSAPKDATTIEGYITLGPYGCSLKEINEDWDYTLKQHINQEHTIVNEPKIDHTSPFGSGLCIKYSYSYVNKRYKEEKEAWDEAIKNYFIELAEYNEWVLKKAESRKVPENIDEKILRAEQRLANLKAAKAGEDVPFPDN